MLVNQKIAWQKMTRSCEAAGKRPFVKLQIKYTAIQWNIERDRKRALIRGQLLDELEGCYTQSTSLALTTRFFNKWAICQSFYILRSAIMWIAQIQKPLIFVKAVQVKLELQQKQEVDCYRSSISAGCLDSLQSCSSTPCTLFLTIIPAEGVINPGRDVISQSQILYITSLLV